MPDATIKQTRKRDWRAPIAVGVAVGVSAPVWKAAERDLQGPLGEWGAFAASVVIAAFLAASAAWLAARWIMPPAGDRG